MVLLERNSGPVVMVLDGDSRLTLQLAEELSQDLRATIIGIGWSADTHLLRSRYCDIKDVAPPQHESAYQGAVLQLTNKHRPDAVLLVHHHSVVALDAIRDQVPEEVSLRIPRSDALKASLDKGRTLAAARAVGIQVPEDYTSLVRDLASSERNLEDLEHLPFPIFMKAAQETHAHIAAKIDSPSQFWPMYDELKRMSEQMAGDGTVLVQEYVNSDGYNHCYGLLVVENKIELSFGHKKIRSVPREFGSAVRVRSLHDTHLRAMSVELVRELDLGDGVALVEYKKRSDGTYVLMEVNPRFWGAYAFARKSGYHFASTMVARSLGLTVESPPAPTASTREMWFPTREIAFLLENRRKEPFLKSLVAAGWPPCRWDVNMRDLRAWLPPGGLRSVSKRLQSLKRPSGRSS